MELCLLAKVPFIMHIVAVLWVLIAILLVGMVLLQKGRGGGLGAAIGGGMAQSLLGSKTGDFFTWVTICLVVLFLGIAVLMAKFYRPIPAVPQGTRPIQTAPAEMTPETTEAAPEQAPAAPAPDETPAAPEQAPQE